MEFWKNNGTRLLYGGIATVFALAFYLYFDEMKGEAKTILIGVAMQCYNKMRGERVIGSPKPPEKPI